MRPSGTLPHLGRMWTLAWLASVSSRLGLTVRASTQRWAGAPFKMLPPPLRVDPIPLRQLNLNFVRESHGVDV